MQATAGGAPKVVVAGAGGEVRVVDLAPATYRVTVALAGFLTAELAAVEVGADTPARIEVVLARATFADSIDVAGVGGHDTIEATELRESGAADVGEALERLPGVWKVRKGGIANDIVLRGFREDDVTVLVDGARVAGACPNRMDPPAFHLDFAEVERVEVDTGSGQMAAQGVLGGLVSIVTGKPSPGFAADAAVVGGSYGLLNPSATASYRDERVAVLVGGSHRSSEPYDDGAGAAMTAQANYSAAVVGEDAYRVGTVWGRLYWQPAAAHELQLSASLQEADRVLYPGLRMDAGYDDTDRLVLGYRWAPRAAGLDVVSATAYTTAVDHWMEDSLRTTAAGAPRGWSMGTMATSRVSGVTAGLETGSLVLGLEAYRREWDAWTEMAGMAYRRQFAIPAVVMDVVGASARWTCALGDDTRLELGGRLDRVTSEADSDLANTDLYAAYHDTRSTAAAWTEPSLAATLGHDLGAGVSLRAGLTSTVRPPDPRELYFALQRQGSDWVGNPALAPPRAERLSLGGTWTSGSVTVVVDAWHDWVDDYITVVGQERVEPVPGVMNAAARSWANLDAALWGTTVEVTAALGERLSLAGGVSYLRGSKEADAALGLSSGNLAEMPPLTARAALRWGSDRLFGEVEGVAADDQDRVDADLGEEPTAGWGVVNLRGGATRGRWRLQLVVKNLLDHTYREHFSYQRDPFRSGFVVNEPGLSVVATLGWRLQP